MPNGEMKERMMLVRFASLRLPRELQKSRNTGKEGREGKRERERAGERERERKKEQ